jgi:hypothetical protein
MDCTAATGVSECLIVSTGTCADVSSQFLGVKRAICQYQKQPDGTTCDDGVCKNGVCEFNLPVAVTDSTDVESEKTYKTEFLATLAGLSVVILLGLVYGALTLCSSDTSTLKTVDDVELAKRSPRMEKLPVGTTTGAGDSHDFGDLQKFPVVQDMDTNGTQYSAIEFNNKESLMNAHFNTQM